MSNGTPEVVTLKERLRPLMEAGDAQGLAQVLAEFDVHPSDVADLLEALDEAERLSLIHLLPSDIASEALAEMEEGDDRAELLAALDPQRGAELLHELADDDAVDLIAELEPAEAQRILDQLPREEAGDLRELLSYDEETAGGLMTTELVALEGRLSAREAVEEVRRQGREVEDFYAIFVVDREHRLLGTVPLDDLILAGADTPVSELVEEVPATVHPDLDQEEVGRLLSRYNLVSVPVVDGMGRLLGRITFDDVLDVIEAERTEDILRLAGVSDEEEVRAGWTGAVRSRLPWLMVNLVTAMVAASVVYMFQHTIEQVVILASIMPIIAGMGGNAGTQALAVTVRRIALSDGPLEQKSDAVMKEMLVGLVNGAAIGVVVAVVATALGQAPTLGLVVLLAMWGNIVVAGFAGAFIPTLLDRLGVDPAVASSVFVTTLTDLCGFFFLLGLATALLL